MHKINYILLIVVFTLNLCVAQSKWTWPKAESNQKVRSFYTSADKNLYLAENRYARADRDREPTTKRPIPGQPQNDDIDDDYIEANDVLTRQNSPYIPPGPVGHSLIAGNFNGFGNYPQIPGGIGGNIANGILVGPGGPTGIIGRPHAQYPAGVGPPQFPLGPGGYPGYPVTQNFPRPPANNNPGFPGYNSINNIFGPHPYEYPNNPQQFAGAQYPQTQFPGVPHYTEGYGLANGLINPGFNGHPQFTGNFNPNYGFGFDEYQAPQVEGKSASVHTIDKKVDDKVTKNFKKI